MGGVLPPDSLLGRRPKPPLCAARTVSHPLISEKSKQLSAPADSMPAPFCVGLRPRERSSRRLSAPADSLQAPDFNFWLADIFMFADSLQTCAFFEAEPKAQL